MSSPSVILFGSPSFGTATLTALSENGYRVVCAVTTSPETPVVNAARMARIPVLTDLASLGNVIDQHASQVGIIAAYGELIPPETIALFPKGILNIHFSLLPKYRGAAPVPHALLAGEEKTGVSIFCIDEGLDTGPILATRLEQIYPEDTSESLYNRLSEIGIHLLVDVLPAYLSGAITSQPQDHRKATYAPPLSREDGRIDVHTPPADLARRIRAFHPWPGVWTHVQIKGRSVRLSLLPKNQAQLEGKRPVSIKQLLEGHSELGEQLQEVLVVWL